MVGGWVVCGGAERGGAGWWCVVVEGGGGWWVVGGVCGRRRRGRCQTPRKSDSRRLRECHEPLPPTKAAARVPGGRGFGPHSALSCSRPASPLGTNEIDNAR